MGLKGLLETATKEFTSRFDGQPDVAVFAPGRVNLMGKPDQHSMYCNVIVQSFFLTSVTL